MPVATSNPLLTSWDTPFGLPPFADIRADHFEPAFEVAMQQHLAQIDAIAAQPQAPGFEDTIAAFDRSGRLFARLEALFYNLSSSETSPELQEAEQRLAPRLAAHSSAIFMHARLFARVDAVHERRSRLELTPQQRRLLERIHLDFVRAGARLGPPQQARLAWLTQRLAELSTRFAHNVLADEAGDMLILRSDSELAGLPGFVRAAARQAAVDRGLPDAWVVTLSRSQIVPFLTFSERRDLRERAYKAWVSRGEHAGEHDNRPIAREILSLRREQARLLGHESYADFALADTMAGRADAVNELLSKVWSPALASVERERAALQALLDRRGQREPVEAWDWRHAAEQLRRERFKLDESEVKPYFPLARMVDALFDCAGRLFGLRFVEQTDIRTYHPDVKVYEVRDAHSRPVGVFLHDNFARPTKRSGAWMSAYRWQSRNGEEVLPIVVNNNNFAKGAADEPTLLSFDDARTLFHEFGHGLHGLLSDVRYERLSGTHVLRDFVELPSQLFEHWLSEPEVLRRHARHWRTGEPIPDVLVQRLKEAETFGQGYEAVRYTASALVDMAIHSSVEDVPDIGEFEARELVRIGLPASVGMNHRLPHFQHLFSGSSYAAGYYVYLWAEVLEADAFDAFTEAGNPFDPALADRLRTFIYASGNTVEPMQAFAAFRGRGPDVNAMLRQRGLLDTA